MRSTPAAQEHNSRRDIFWVSQSLIRAEVCQLLDATTHLHQAVRHFGREEAWGQVVDEDTLRAELESEIAG